MTHDFTNPTVQPSQHPVEIRRIPNDYAMAMLMIGWKITKLHYPIIFGTTAIILGIALAISFVPYLSILASIPMVLLSVGQMSIVRKLIEGKPAEIREVFRAFEDTTWMNALLPLAVSGVAISIVQIGVTKLTGSNLLMSMIGSLANVFLLLVWVALTAFSGPLIAFRNRTFRDSIDLNLRATTLNWQPLLIYAILMMGLGLICLVLLILPVFFVFMPIIYVTAYLCYASIFEGLDVVLLQKVFEDKP